MLKLQHLTKQFGAAPLFTDLCMEVDAPVVLWAPSGWGKTTLLRILMGLERPDSGTVEGGATVKIGHFSQEGRELDLNQRVYDFIHDIADEVRTDEGTFSANQMMERFLFPGDLQSVPIGRLSGGERQRIAIARAILKDAPIVILDEATAFTDPENEDKIQSSIMALSKGKTLLVIAHRLSTIQNADQIVVLEKGSVADCGTQEELLGRCPLYQTLWAAHVGARNWAVTSGKKEGN